MTNSTAETAADAADNATSETSRSSADRAAARVVADDRERPEVVVPDEDSDETLRLVSALEEARGLAAEMGGGLDGFREQVEEAAAGREEAVAAFREQVGERDDELAELLSANVDQVDEHLLDVLEAAPFDVDWDDPVVEAAQEAHRAVRAHATAQWLLASASRRADDRHSVVRTVALRWEAHRRDLEADGRGITGDTLDRVRRATAADDG